MAYGGLRGAVGFSLVMMIDKSIVPSAGIFVTTTLAVVISTVFIQVGILGPNVFTKPASSGPMVNGHFIQGEILGRRSLSRYRVLGL
jgi:hypothetical protein